MTRELTDDCEAIWVVSTIAIMCPMTPLRPILSFTLVVSWILLGAVPTFGQSYPAKYVRIITGPAGAIHDIVARGLAQRLSERWGQSVVVQNQGGAGGTIAAAVA